MIVADPAPRTQESLQYDVSKHCHVFEEKMRKRKDEEDEEKPLSFEAFVYDMKRTGISQTRHEYRK